VYVYQLYLADRFSLRAIDAPGLGKRIGLHPLEAFAHGLLRTYLRRVLREMEPVKDVGVEQPSGKKRNISLHERPKTHPVAVQD
jgi:hypothetical protein